MEERFAIQEERMSAMLSVIDSIAERVDQTPEPPSSQSDPTITPALASTVSPRGLRLGAENGSSARFARRSCAMGLRWSPLSADDRVTRCRLNRGPCMKPSTLMAVLIVFLIWGCASSTPGPAPPPPGGPALPPATVCSTELGTSCTSTRPTGAPCDCDGVTGTAQ
jgi:hypothetical protein